MQKKIGLIVLLFMASLHGLGQANRFHLMPLSLETLTSFQTPAPNWKISGPLAATYRDTALVATPGTGVLVNQFNRSIQYAAAANLLTQMEHGDLYLEMDVMMARGSNSGIYLQGRYEVQLLDSWQVAAPTFTDMGGIYERWDDAKTSGSKGFEGQAPLQSAAFAPGLWQHLEIQFQGPRFDASGKKTANARFLKVVLNGITIHENIIVSGPTRASAFQDEQPKGPIMIQGDHGPVAFKNIRYAPLEDLRVPITGMTYQYFEGPHETIEKFTAKELVRKGNAEQIDGRLADAKDNFLLHFSGTMEVPATDTYDFMMQLSGMGSLEIDGQPVIPLTWTWVGGNLVQGSIKLTQGKHTFQLKCLKHVGWAPAGLGLFVRKPNSKTIPLHSLSSLPERPPTPLILQKAGKEPTLLRSFMMHNGKKLTHCISVGDPTGVHYAYNLRQGALLGAWKGEFLNTTEMWHDRGEPQTAEKMGAGPNLNGLSMLAPDKNQLADTVSYETLIYRGYRLNAERYPAFAYGYGPSLITDQLVPSNKGQGLQRNITVTQAALPAGTVFRLASGTEIRDLGAGLYAIDGQSWYLQWNSSVVKPYVQQHNGKAYLLADATGSSSIQYTMIW